MLHKLISTHLPIVQHSQLFNFIMSLKLVYGSYNNIKDYDNAILQKRRKQVRKSQYKYCTIFIKYIAGIQVLSCLPAVIIHPL